MQNTKTYWLGLGLLIFQYLPFKKYTKYGKRGKDKNTKRRKDDFYSSDT